MGRTPRIRSLPSRAVRSVRPSSPALMRHPAQAGPSSQEAASTPGSPAAGQPLEPRTRLALESRLGHDFGRVRVHTGPEADRSAAELGAHAFTLGLDVHFRNGRYRPDQPAGQALLTHELEHVARAGPGGPAVPRLAPDPGAGDDETQIRALLTAAKPKPQALLRYIDSHAGSLAVAERLLASGVAGGSTVKLLRSLLSKYPDSETSVAQLVRAGTGTLRADAEAKTLAMWNQYKSAAYAYAVVQWATKQRDAEKKKRPRPARGSRTKPEPSNLELQYEAWRAQAQTRFDGLAAERPAALADSDAAIKAMLAAAQPVPFAQADVLEGLADKMHGSIDEARTVRVRTFEDVALLSLKESPAVARQRAKDQQAFDKAKTAEDEARAARQPLGPATPAFGPQLPMTKRQAAALKKARQAETRATAAREKAGAALTWQGSKNKEVKAFLRSQDPEERAAAEARLTEARALRDTQIGGVLPTGVDFMAFDVDALLPDDQRWWIYHTALNNLGASFPGFSSERSLVELVSSRSIVAKNRTALGVDYSVSLGTYTGHGEGQYDIHSPAGKDVVAVQPATVDLTRILSPGGSSAPRIFEWQSTKVKSATQIGPSHGDDDVLAKLVYGFFGRDKDTKANVEAYLADPSTVKRSPDASRVIGALVLDNTLPASPISDGVKDARLAIREKLETALRTELAALNPKVEIPDTTKILATVKASEGSFGGVSMITPEAWEIFKAVPAARRGKGKPYASKGKASAAVFKAAVKILSSSNEISTDVGELIRTLWTPDAKGRSGPAVTLIHHYKEPGSGKEAWIEVDYRHLSGVEALTQGADVASDTVIGQVGSSGNAVSPHIHQAIRVYEKNPKDGALVIGYLVPLDFFPFVLPGRRRPTAAPAGP